MMLLAISPPIILFLSAAGVVQGILLAATLFFHPRADKAATGFLSLHILTVSIFMLMPVAQYFISWQSIILLIPFQFLIGPALYLYVRSFKEIISIRKAIPHFLLFLAFLVIDTPIYFAWVREYPSSDNMPAQILLEPISYIHIIIRNVQMLLYYFLARRSLRSYQNSIRHIYSETSKISLEWVRWLLNGFLLLIISVFILFYFVFKFPGMFSLFILINTAIITPYIYIVTLKGMSQPTLWQLHPGKDKEQIEKEIAAAEAIDSSKNEKSDRLFIRGLSGDKATGIITRILQLMETDKLYQEPELTIQTLSDKLGIQAYQASQAINEGLKKSFYDLVNNYRVEEAKRLLVDPRNTNYTILSVGFEAGFNSKTTFNTVFKKFTGLTPTEYKEKQKESRLSV
jgi:AraC-like DNA-binding protein